MQSQRRERGAAPAPQPLRPEANHAQSYICPCTFQFCQPFSSPHFFYKASICWDFCLMKKVQVWLLQTWAFQACTIQITAFQKPQCRWDCSFRRHLLYQNMPRTLLPQRKQDDVGTSRPSTRSPLAAGWASGDGPVAFPCTFRERPVRLQAHLSVCVRAAGHGCVLGAVSFGAGEASPLLLRLPRCQSGMSRMLCLFGSQVCDSCGIEELIAVSPQWNLRL